MRVCVYAIAKNEEQFVDRFMDAAEEADVIVVADTGSTDKTISKLNEWAGRHRADVILRTISIKPWRFDHARNAVLSMVPSDVDVCVSLDLDEILQPGWRKEIERVWEVGKTTRLSYLFDWGLGIAFWYEKIHARHGYYWHHPLHEYPMPDGRITEVWARTSPDFLMVIHKPDSTKSRGSYLDILKLSVTEDPYCPRNAFYYARELSFYDHFDDAIRECQRYLALPRATWVNERCYAYRVMGRCYTAKGDLNKAHENFLLAAAAAPNTREPWYELAKCCYSQGRWHECFAFAMRCLSITDREKVYTVDPIVWTFEPHLLATVGAWHLGVWDTALAQAKIALDMAPDDILLKNNYKSITDKMEKLKCPATKSAEPTPSAKMVPTEQQLLNQRSLNFDGM
jgi:tetratricopeptide (TPR) repeat protein